MPDPKVDSKVKMQTDTRSSNELNLYPPFGAAAVNKESIHSVTDISNWLWAKVFQKCGCYLPLVTWSFKTLHHHNVRTTWNASSLIFRNEQRRLWRTLEYVFQYPCRDLCHLLRDALAFKFYHHTNKTLSTLSSSSELHSNVNTIKLQNRENKV